MIFSTTLGLHTRMRFTVNCCVLLHTIIRRPISHITGTYDYNSIVIVTPVAPLSPQHQICSTFGNQIQSHFKFLFLLFHFNPVKKVFFHSAVYVLNCHGRKSMNGNNVNVALPSWPASMHNAKAFKLHCLNGQELQSVFLITQWFS